MIQRDLQSRITEIDTRVVYCRRCPRLVAWREEVALQKRAAFASQPAGHPASRSPSQPVREA